jgi:hypothetical protein
MENDIKFKGATMINLVAGALQVIFCVLVFSTSFYPKLPHTNDKLWQIKGRVLFFTIVLLVGSVLLPIVSIVWAISIQDINSNIFLWLIAAIVNTLYVDFVVIKTVGIKLCQLISTPKFPTALKDEALGMSSIAI